jgi:acetylornithine deacetylase/succinyl-diaminopimelate desuccinylase-like protein
VGVISGGTTVNTIAAEAHMELDLRSESTRALEDLIQRVEGVLQTARRPDVKITCEEIGKRPPGRISTSHPLVKLAKRSIEAQGIAANLGIGSTDANIPLSQELPAVCIGLTTGGSAHTVNEFIYTSPLHQGLEQLISLVEGAFKELN